ncbi:hypothetical protein [Aeromonas media]|uniref:hypothetical protein n=1 Tax=Aeromonas media TaxID=651 RepID=UPI00227F9FF6|nr:hypothetical protein [Aeromonas media]MCY9823069.1 hypothetical protein [Aeromonas media]
MKDLLKSLKDNATSRLNNPIVGAFVLSWMFLNINGVARFILEGNQGKLDIIKNKNWVFTDDLVIPFLVSIGYLVLLPILNAVYSFIHDNCIDKVRDENSNKAQKDAFLRRKETVSAKIESTDEYVVKLKDKELDLWAEQKLELIREIINLKGKYSKLLSDFELRSKEFRSENNKMSLSIRQLEDANKNLSAQDSEQRDYIRKVVTNLDKLLNSIENKILSDNKVDEIEKIRNEISDVRNKFYLWDDDIPF